jgi:hypothetical protein
MLCQVGPEASSRHGAEISDRRRNRLGPGKEVHVEGSPRLADYTASLVSLLVQPEPVEQMKLADVVHGKVGRCPR